MAATVFFLLLAEVAGRLHRLLTVGASSHLLRGFSQHSAHRTFDTHAALRCWLASKSIRLPFSDIWEFGHSSCLEVVRQRVMSGTFLKPAPLIPCQRGEQAVKGKWSASMGKVCCCRYRWGSSPERNRTGPVQLVSTVESRRVQSLQLRPQTVSSKTSAPWIGRLIYRRKRPPCLSLPSVGSSKPSRPPSPPPLSLLLRPERFESLWLPEWFSIKPRLLKGPSDFLKK